MCADGGRLVVVIAAVDTGDDELKCETRVVLTSRPAV
jgi:hypothetical protein